ncbi:MAG: BolA/IbaG family iron-sulfur metabolism protein [Gammaproteobacteria bacterium]|nr:MAG: BolA/IbaG family iron-sulfur metabolism protein [Gammaproteobacteria bacterium]
MTADELRQMIVDALPGARVEVSGDGDHFEAVVVSERFEGLPLVQRHQAVYAALGDAFSGALHALSLRTLTPAEAEG